MTACTEPLDHSLSLPFSVTLDNGLLSAYGEVLPSMDLRCGIDPGDNPPPTPGSQRILVDLATPLTVFSDNSGQPPQPFRDGQFSINATQPDGSMGPTRFMLCDMPLLRGNQPLSEFRLERQAPGGPLVSTGPLDGVLGGDMFGQFALSFSFVATGDAAPTAAEIMINHSDVTPSCLIDDAVLPFTPVGGDLLVQVGDSTMTYSPVSITVGACVEPIADPLILHTGALAIDSCIDPAKFGPVSQTACAEPLDLLALGDTVDAQQARRPAYVPSGVDMRFLLSTAVPDLLLSETACSRLNGSAERCQCDDSQKVSLRLPGLDGPQPDGSFYIEQGCPIKLGNAAQAGVALVASELHLSPCAELARSRRQRYALPNSTPPPGLAPESDCLHEACLDNLARQSNLTIDRCAYTGMLVDEACDDHLAPVAPFVEMGGPRDDESTGFDEIDALVVPDTAQILRSANTDLRNMTSQLDGVIGVSLLERMHTVVDYPQMRMVLSCRCSGWPTQVCHAYRSVSYYDADHCVPPDTIIIPPDFGRTLCR